MTVVSIIIPLYNGVEYLEECVRSVISQTFTDWEVIIGINGHGYDGGQVAPIANQIASLDSRIKVRIQPPPLKGKVESSNDLVNQSSADWICMLDCDDKWEPKKLEKQIIALQTVAHDAVVIGTFCQYFGEHSGNVPIPAGFIHSSYLERSNPIVNSSAMIRRDVCFWKYEDVSETMEDYSLWMNIALQGKKLYNVPEYLTWHRIHKTSAFNSKFISDIPLRTRYGQLHKQMKLRSIVYENTYDTAISNINRFIHLAEQSMVTFIIPSTNQHNLIYTLSSIVQQIRTNWRAIVVFYGCEPTDPAVLSILQDTRFLYFCIKRLQTNYAALYEQIGYIRNIGLQFVHNTDWVGFIDEGDTITRAYLSCVEHEVNYTHYAEAIIFKMKCGNDIFPPQDCYTITQQLVGSSFAIRSHIVTQGYTFTSSAFEDFHFLHHLKSVGKPIVMSPFVVYCVKHTPHDDSVQNKEPDRPYTRRVINPR